MKLGKPFFYCCLAGCLALAAVPAWHIAKLVFTEDQYSHIAVTPFLIGYVLYTRRQALKPKTCQRRSALFSAWILLGVGLAIRAIGWKYQASLSGNDSLSIAALSLVVFLVSGFVFRFNGIPKGTRFPLSLLLLLVPIPDLPLGWAIAALQRGSADIVSVLYSLLNIPFLREGVVFRLPQGAIEIAEECSGIRSSIALLIVSLLAGELLLRTGWKKVALTASILPLVLIKNGIRIVTLSLLGFYVNPGFLTGRLHREGGFVFFLLALFLWIPWLDFLCKSEHRKETHPEQEPSGTVRGAVFHSALTPDLKDQR